ncbi:MAG: hypothetical protein ACLUEK_04910 [Oscillospiraceae bacterium]
MRVFRTDGSQVYFSGGTQLLGRSGEVWLVKLADGTTAVMDAYSRVVVSGDCSFIEDAATGVTYIYDADSGRLYDESGSYLASGCTGLVIDGFVCCDDGASLGWKSSRETSGSSASRPGGGLKKLPKRKRGVLSAPFNINRFLTQGGAPRV